MVFSPASKCKEIKLCDNVWECVLLYRDGHGVELKLCLWFSGEWQLKFSSYVRVETSTVLEIRVTNALFARFSHSTGLVFNIMKMKLPSEVQIYFCRSNHHTNIILHACKFCFLYFIKYFPHSENRLTVLFHVSGRPVFLWNMFFFFLSAKS